MAAAVWLQPTQGYLLGSSSTKLHDFARITTNSPAHIATCKSFHTRITSVSGLRGSVSTQILLAALTNSDGSLSRDSTEGRVLDSCKSHSQCIVCTAEEAGACPLDSGIVELLDKSAGDGTVLLKPRSRYPSLDIISAHASAPTQLQAWCEAFLHSMRQAS